MNPTAQQRLIPFFGWSRSKIQIAAVAVATVLIFAGFKVLVWATISAVAIVWTKVAAVLAATARLKVGWSGNPWRS